MEKHEFCQRLAALRIQKGVSARDMSLSIGQSAGYINNIENGVNLPSMSVFFYICEYLGITPRDFFDFESGNPSREHELLSVCRALNDAQMERLIAFLRELRK